MKKRYILLFVIIGFGLVFWLLLRDASAPTVTDSRPRETALAPETSPAQKDDLIIVRAPLPLSTISSPLVITGSARGNWYFEASFPIELRDGQGNLLAQTIATAQGDWMTTNYVPFTASLSYVLPPALANTTGYLILRKDNPSGEAQYDNSLQIPVTL